MLGGIDSRMIKEAPNWFFDSIEKIASEPLVREDIKYKFGD